MLQATLSVDRGPGVPGWDPTSLGWLRHDAELPGVLPGADLRVPKWGLGCLAELLALHREPALARCYREEPTSNLPCTPHPQPEAPSGRVLAPQWHRTEEWSKVCLKEAVPKPAWAPRRLSGAVLCVPYRGSCF